LESKGIGSGFNRLYTDRFGQIPIPLPPSDEQAAIVRFLDWANGRLERAIRAKRRVIALLTEQKQAIIHRAVTRGIDPSVPLKDSGVPWLGEIPAHWEVWRAKYIFREVDERSKEGKETHLSMSQRLGLVPSARVNSAMRSESYMGAKLCTEGDLVLNRLKAHLGVFALSKQVGVISPDYTVFRKRANVSMDYYESVLRSSACRRELRIRAKGLVEGFWRLYTDDFYDIRLPVPPLDEQRIIMATTTAQTSGLDTAISRLEREITLLREYRTRLVADVVTGKLDVRQAAAALPEEEPIAEVTDLPDLDDDFVDNEDSNDSEGDA
jgi:type I restriction enzyme S subunit